MDLLSSLIVGRESLLTHGTAMSVVADNLANSNTPGFKTQRAEFSHLLTEGLGSLFGSPMNAGEGVILSDIKDIHTQGPIDFTDRSLDVAVSGEGFFILNDGTDTYYTRAGNFSTNGTGNVVASSGENVMGFTTASPTTLVPLNTTSVTQSATPTTTVGLTGNLDATSPPVLTVPANPATYAELTPFASFQSSVAVIDSLGVTHDVGLYFFRTGPGTWTAQAYVDSGDVSEIPGAPTSLGETQITFSETGTQPPDAAVTLALSPAWANGAAAGSITVDLSDLTGFGSPSNFNTVTTDGNAAGSVSGVQIEENGNVVALLDNGSSISVGTIALATFPNTGGLDKVGDNRFRETTDSGAPVVGNPETSGRGSTLGGALELSTVDPANEFVNIISYQRAYQAGSQVISTASELLNTTIQIA